MKRVLLFLMIVGLNTTVFSQKSENRSVSGFTGINASNTFDIKVTKGNSEKLTIEADNDVMQFVRSEVKNGILHLYLDNSAGNIRDVKTLKATIVMKNLDNVVLSGACKLTANDVFTSDKFKIDCSGVSNLTVNVNTGQLSIETSGAAKIQIKANVSGNSNLNVSGVSQIKGELKTADMKINSSGASLVELAGSATNIKLDLSGTARINAGNFAVKNANIDSSGASNATVNVFDTLKVNSSGTATVNYKGSPTLEVNSSRISKVKQIQ